jgi:hypothetical protein
VSQTTLDRADPPDHEPGDRAGTAGPVGAPSGERSTVPDQRATDRRLDDIERGIGRHDMGVGVLLGLAFVVMIASVIAIGLIQRNSGGSGAASLPGQTITAELSEFAVTLSAADVTPNSTINVTNTGTMAHTLGVLGTDLITPSIPPGGTATLDLAGLDPSSYTLFCDVPGHLDSGMKTPLTVGDGTTVAGSGSGAGAMGMTADEHAAMTAEEGAVMDQAMMESIMAFPA